MMNQRFARPALRLFLCLSQCMILAASGTASGISNRAQLINLPFVGPSATETQDESRKVFAHYFPPYPISLDNAPAENDYYARHFLSPEGESGKHAAYGGFLRDRPPPQRPLVAADSELENLKTEVAQASAGGIDGFTVDLLTLGTRKKDDYWQRVKKLLQAASMVDPDFKIVLMPDSNGQLAEASLSELATAIAQLANYSSTYRLPDGRLVVMPFHPEAKGANFWRRFMRVMRDRFGEEIALIPTFVFNPSEYISEYAKFSYGVSHWGGRNPAYNNPARRDDGSPRDLSERLHSLGLKWIQPVSVQDARPYSGVYDEALNTANLRNSWQTARDVEADWAHVISWNDYSEGSHIAPSVKHGAAYVQANAYYSYWFKYRKPPILRRNMAVLSHRTQFAASNPVFPQKHLMKVAETLPGLGVAPVDQVEVLFFLIKPAQVTVATGGREKSATIRAGVSTIVVPLSEGLVEVTIRQSGITTKLTSRHPVTAKPRVQDLQYGASSTIF